MGGSMGENMSKAYATMVQLDVQKKTSANHVQSDPRAKKATTKYR